MYQKKLNRTETQAFEKHHRRPVKTFESIPQCSFFEPLYPAQQLYETLRFLRTDDEAFFRCGRAPIHLNGQAEMLMGHFRHQGMTGLLGFDSSFVEKRSCCHNCEATKTTVNASVAPVRYGQSNVPLFCCSRCGSRYSGRRATALWNMRLCEKDFLIVCNALAEGTGIRTTSRILDVDKDTVQRCALAAGLQCQFVESVLMHHLHLEECQLDEMWSFVYKKQGHLDPFEQLLDDLGDIWLHVAFEARLKLFVAIVPAKRTLDSLRTLIRAVRLKSDNHMPLFTSDEYSGNLDALLWEYGRLAQLDRQGLAGRPSESTYLVPSAGLRFAVVQKTREKGRIKSVQPKVVFGTKRNIQRTLSESPCSRSINISFVERSHLHQRLNNRRVTRKTLGFSKKLSMHEAQIWLSRGYYHFVRPHSSLKIESNSGGPSISRTPAMAAGVTDHIWNMRELLTFPNGYDIQ
jgi:IS1 family transposase/transposase-like protein